jgi:hypothetical protein
MAIHMELVTHRGSELRAIRFTLHTATPKARAEIHGSGSRKINYIPHLITPMVQVDFRGFS